MNSEVLKWSVTGKLWNYKSRKDLIPIEPNLWLETMTANELDEEDSYLRMIRWREKNQEWYPTQFPISKDGTIKWYREQIYGREDRILFWVCCGAGKIGHVGLSSFNWDEQTCELDNILRGNDLEPGAMSKAIEWLVKMALNNLMVKRVGLRTFSDNKKALRFYRNCGFRSIKKVGTRKEVVHVEGGERISYIEDENGHSRYFVYMEYKK